MRKLIGLAIALLLLTTVGCSLPKMTLFGAKQEPLKEYNLQGEGKGKVLVWSMWVCVITTWRRVRCSSSVSGCRRAGSKTPARSW